MFFRNSLAFSMIQQMLAIWSLVPLPFSKPSLNIWKFTIHILLKPGLENFEYYFTSMWGECNCAVVWAFFGIGMKTDLFKSCGHCWVSSKEELTLPARINKKAKEEEHLFGHTVSQCASMKSFTGLCAGMRNMKDEQNRHDFYLLIRDEVKKYQASCRNLLPYW